MKKPAADLPSDDFFEATSHKPLYPTGVPEYSLGGRIEGIHVLGILHGHPKTIERLTTAIIQFNPDIVAVEASREAIFQHHPDQYELDWPPEHELEAAGYAARHNDSLSIAGIDLPHWEWPLDGKERFAKVDADVLSELGVIDTPSDLTSDSYHLLDLPTIRKWRERTQLRIPDLFNQVITIRDDAMAGHLHELYQMDTVDTVVAVVGMQHLTGVLDRLQIPYLIPDTRFERPPIYTYNPSELKEQFR
ncbi:hypothetical protein CP556_14620 [Natrinema sp. CBA1119]|nr:hypothetical protein CP556_14620 [Natrinema sp. CBA1119]